MQFTSTRRAHLVLLTTMASLKPLKKQASLIQTVDVDTIDAQQQLVMAPLVDPHSFRCCTHCR